MSESPHQAKDLVEELITGLETPIAGDPEREVPSWAVPALDEALEHVKGALTGHPVIDSIASIVKVDRFRDAEPVRAAEALIVARALSGALGRRPIQVAKLKRGPIAR